MFYNIPYTVVENYIKAELPYKPVNNNPHEFKICSIYTQDVKFKCYINSQKFQFCDFKSGTTGSCYYLFKDLIGVETNEQVLTYLMRNYSFNGEKFDFEKKKNEVISASNVIEEFIECDKPIFFREKDKIGNYGKRCLRYLMDRKIDVSYIREMGYVYNENSKFTKRIVIPYIEDHRMAYFQARSIDKNNKLRYMNPAGLGSKDFVFNYDKLNDDELIICEGPFDAMSLSEQTATCMCSGDLSPKQLIKIFGKAKPKTIIYVPDADETGRKKMDANIQRIFTYADYSPKVLVFHTPNETKDLNEMLVKTGKDFILRKECEVYNPRKHKFSWEN